MTGWWAWSWGADDYLVKPFSIRELLLRVKKLLARVRPQPDNKEIIQRGPLCIDIPRHLVTVQGDPVALTAKEFQLLVNLARRAGRLQTRDQLLRDVWDIDADVTTRTVDTHVKSLRQKLGPQVDFIETVRGYGYRFREEL